ncbi:MAG: LysM peptidoglycan-binding domain-containing protein [Anaerolineales bacterium]|nr:LysM peptidoglycan-binding domain-containing protein [Anaerolineales bacterium]
MNPLKKLSLALVAFAMLLSMVAANITSAAAAPASGTTIPNCTQWHVVQSGDYLSKIALQYNTTVSKLIEINELDNPNLIYVGQNLCVSVTAPGSGTPAPTLPNTASGIRVFATSVKEDLSVTLQGKSLAGSSSYSIYLSNYKVSQGTSYLLATVTTASDGSFTGTYTLPNKLRDVSKIKIVVKNSVGDTASNWFYNLTSNGNPGGIGSPTLTLTVISVKEGKTVKIQASNLLPDVTYEVMMGKTGTEGIDGILVGTINNAKGGTTTVTFDIPADLAGRSKIDLRVANNPYDLTAFVTFQND